MPSQPARMVYLEYHDAANNSHKFYASIVFSSKYFFHYGRVGTAGQNTRMTNVGGSFAATRAAREKLDEKQSEGYQHLGEYDFTVDLPPGFSGTKDQLAAVAAQAMRKRAQHNAGRTPAPTSTPVQPDAPASTADQVTRLQEQVLAALGLAVTDPNAALVQYALLNEQYRELQSQMERAGSYLGTLDQLLLGVTV